jgi:hypothetical protein
MSKKHGSGTVRNDEMAPFQLIYSKYFQPKSGALDRNFYYQWLRTSSNKTPSHFESFILNSKEYRQKLLHDFQKVYVELIDSNFSETTFTSFLQQQQVAKKNATAESGGVEMTITTTIMKQYIRKLPTFAEKYKQIITRLYRIVHNSDIDDALLTMYYDKIVEDETYTIDRLNEDILFRRQPDGKNDGEFVTTSDNLLEYIKDTWQQLQGYEPMSYHINHLLEIMADSRKIIFNLIANYRLLENKNVDILLRGFMTVYGREISIYEFIKFYPCLGKIQNHDEVVAWLQEKHKTHGHALQVVRNIYKKYLSEDLTEHDYLKRYSKTVDADDFQDIVIRELAASSAYAEKMCTKVRTIYTEMYKSELPKDDEKYMFDQIRYDLIDLKNSKINESVIAIKEETDKYYKELSDIYARILEREPDLFERKHYKKLYREHKDIDKTNLHIQEDLYNSLEYHEILKKHIQGYYRTKQERDLFPSQLYSLLNKALGDTMIARSDARIKEMIDAYCAHYEAQEHDD